jgi:hypothetical protein
MSLTKSTPRTNVDIFSNKKPTFVEGGWTLLDLAELTKEAMNLLKREGEKK